MHSQLEKNYSPHESEKLWIERWESARTFASQPNQSKEPYSILMPPPNVTGVLHFGHVLNLTIQDVYSRWNRLLGKEVCWFPGTDHAGIATQTKVEQLLRSEGKSRHDLGRDAFVEKVWEWKAKYGEHILNQMRSLGVSVDWDRNLFTMDDSASNAVTEVFVRLFDEGLIYKGKRIINWSPLAQSALSDEEVQFKEVKEFLYTMKYNVQDSDEVLLVATVRPETIFGDVAVAVNPTDERYAHLIGKLVHVPLASRWVPVIADDYADPTFGTGCVKITPAHDPNDFEVGLRHSLEMPNSINADATLNHLAGEFAGLDRFEARKRIVEKLLESELLEKTEDYTHNVGFSERGGEPIEPYLSDQWFVKMKPLAEPALKVVLDGQIKFHPNHWIKTYEHWMKNVRDWCISRQLWWGHRIPVYYAPDGSFTAARTKDEARKKMNLDASTVLTQDSDVLDTWFSSWLWPMTTMRWLDPANESAENNHTLSYYLEKQSTNLLVTAPEIIFFWVARMIISTLHFKKTIPFRDVYFTSIVRDGKGRKMSKSLGNSPEPLDLMARYGTDAVRFTMAYLSPLGIDVRLAVSEKDQDIPQFELGRNFANKIWNAGRFLLMKCEEAEYDVSAGDTFGYSLSASDRWIRSRVANSTLNITNLLENYKVTDYAKELYDLAWRDFCDWYVEIFKVQFNGLEDPESKKGLCQFGIETFKGILHLLHPLMPFITEELWKAVRSESDQNFISISSVTVNTSHLDSLAMQEFELLQSLVEELRSLRTTFNISPQTRLPIELCASSSDVKSTIEKYANILRSFAKTDLLVISSAPSTDGQWVASVFRGIDLRLRIEGTLDIEKEVERLGKEVDRLSGLISQTEKKLSNENFMSRAGEDVIASETEKLSSLRESLAKVNSIIDTFPKQLKS